MTMSPKPDFLSEISEGIKIPEAKMAYFEQRALNGFYDYVMRRFAEEQKNSKLTKATLANRIGRGQDQVNRLLASPGNWTIGTLARLLVGIAGEEPILTSKKLAGRKPQNMTVEALLEPLPEQPTKLRLTQPPTATASNAKAIEVKFEPA